MANSDQKKIQRSLSILRKPSNKYRSIHSVGYKRRGVIFTPRQAALVRRVTTPAIPIPPRFSFRNNENVSEMPSPPLSAPTTPRRNPVGECPLSPRQTKFELPVVSLPTPPTTPKKGRESVFKRMLSPVKDCFNIPLRGKGVLSPSTPKKGRESVFKRMLSPVKDCFNIPLRGKGVLSPSTPKVCISSPVLIDSTANRLIESGVDVRAGAHDEVEGEGERLVPAEDGKEVKGEKVGTLSGRWPGSMRYRKGMHPRGVTGGKHAVSQPRLRFYKTPAPTYTAEFDVSSPHEMSSCSRI
jgi:hypothetical protein